MLPSWLNSLFFSTIFSPFFQHKNVQLGNCLKKAGVESRKWTWREMEWQGVLVCCGCCNKVPQTEWLKPQKCIVSQFWRLEVKISMLARWFLLRAVRKYLLNAPLVILVVCQQSLVSLNLQMHHPDLCHDVHVEFSPSVSVSKFLLFIRISVILIAAHSSELILTWLTL